MVRVQIYAADSPTITTYHTLFMAENLQYCDEIISPQFNMVTHMG
jgi:hypothetical protein